MAFLHSPQPNLGISAEPTSPARTKFFLNDGSLRNLRVWMATILGIGLAVRMTLILVNSHSAQYGGEPYNIALSLANHGTMQTCLAPARDLLHIYRPLCR